MSIIKIPCIDQTRHWPTGCESATAVMLLQALGVPMTMERWVQDFLECRNFTKSAGQLIGPDPRKFFAGDPADPDGMGCWSGALARFLNKAFTVLEIPYQAEAADGAPPKMLRESLQNGIPAAYWATIDAKPAIPGPDWLLEDSGEVFHWRSNEHCMLLVGMDEENYWFNDPLHAACSPAPWPKALAEQRHAEQRNMTVLVKPV